MTAIRMVLALTLAALAGCDDRIGDYPALLPTDQILAEPAVPGHAADSASDPAAMTAGLQGRRSTLTSQAPGPVASDAALSGRADALRARAGALSKATLGSCPEGRACAGQTDAAPSATPTDDPAMTRRIEELRARSKALTETPQKACPEGITTCPSPETPEAVVKPEE